MPVITIYRPQVFMGAARKLRVSIDFVDVGGVEFGKEASYTVESGLHDVQVSMDWCKSESLLIEVTESTDVALEVRFAPLLLAIVYVFVNPAGVFTLVPIQETPRE